MEKLTISMDIAIQKLRQVYNLSENFEIEIVTEKSVTPVSDNDDWIDVLHDWTNPYAPETAKRYGMIDIIRRSGTTQTGYATSWDQSWVQENDRCNIVKYRKHRG